MMSLERALQCAERCIENRNITNEDIEQDLYLFAMENCGDYDDDGYLSYGSLYKNLCRLIDKLNIKYDNLCSYEKLDKYEELTGEDAYSVVYSKELDNIIQNSFNLLNETEKMVLELRFGFYGDPMRLNQIARMFDRSPVRVQQIQQTALRKIRSHNKYNDLMPYLNII